MLLMRVRWSLRDKMRILYVFCRVGRLQWDVLIGAAKTARFSYVPFIWSYRYGVRSHRIEILCATAATRRQAMKPNRGLNRWRILGVSLARPVDDRRQLWSFSGNVVPHRATYSSICWMIVLLRNQVWRRSIGQHFRRQHRIADSPPN